jgi:hypothetical protein
MDNDLTSLLFVAILLLALIYFFIKIALRMRKHGGSMTTTMHAATYEFLSKDMRESVKEVVEIKANKKMEEESSDKPKLD